MIFFVENILLISIENEYESFLLLPCLGLFSASGMRQASIYR